MNVMCLCNLTLLKAVLFIITSPGKRNLHFTTTETKTGKKALTHKGCTLWNKLSEGLKTIKSVVVFKHRIRDYHISNYIV